VVPDERKSVAVQNTIYNEISTECPATILRKHPDTVLFLDLAAASPFKKSKIFYGRELETVLFHVYK